MGIDGRTKTNQRNNAEGQRSGGAQSNQQYADANPTSSPTSPPSTAAFNAGSSSAHALSATLDQDQNYNNVSYGHGQLPGNGDGGY